MQAVRAFISEWFKQWWGLMGCAAFTFLGIYAAATQQSNRWIVGASAAAGVVMFFVASYQAWKRQYDDRQLLTSRTKEAEDRIAHLEAAVFGGNPFIDPPTMRIIQQSPSFNEAHQAAIRACLHLVIDHLPLDSLVVHLEFTWSYTQIIGNITQAKFHNTLEARDNARDVSWERRGLYGCLVTLPSPPTENTFLRLHIYSDSAIQVKSMSAVTPSAAPPPEGPPSPTAST